ncbi:MAG TPA: helix-turn-helix domain-containing protein [Beijerinckiaceae bacterium]|nr:helix-turn-helix domain-containing protein [Beijerinckiaceae bacterium]
MHTTLATTAVPAPTDGIRFPAAPLARPARDTVTPAVGATRRLGKDEEVFGEGDRAAYFYKVVSGAVRTSKLLSDGRRQIDAFHLAGDMFGIESGDEHRFSAEAVGDAAVVVYRRCALDTLAAQDGAFAREIVAAMMRALERAQEHMLLLGRKSAIEKIASFLLDMAERACDNAIELPMSRIDIADHLGLTIETVSRSLTQLERKGLIALPAQRRTIRLRHKAALENLRA